MPLLKKRFPAAASTLSRTSTLCAEASILLAKTARDDFKFTLIGDNQFSANALYDLGEIRVRNVFHQWFRDNNYPTPTAAHMKRLWEDVVCTSDESCPLVTWSGVDVRRYRDVIHIISSLRFHDAKTVLRWNMEEPLVVEGLGRLSCMSHRTKDENNL